MEIRFGIRRHGRVTHILRESGISSLCGRAVVEGESCGERLCATCHRIRPGLSIPTAVASQRPSVAFREAAAPRKAQREPEMRGGVEVGEPRPLSYVYQLTADELAMTHTKIDRINARCAKRGIPGGLVVDSKLVTEKRTNFLGIDIEISYYNTRISGIAPRIDGWEFLATIDHDPHAGMVVRSYPGAVAVDRTLIRAGWCDHCQTIRDRKATYIVRNTSTGEQVQVGSSCVKDFTGWTALPYQAEGDISALERGYGASLDITTLTALAVAWAVVKHCGYRKTSEAHSTRSMVEDVLWPPRDLKAQDKAHLQFLRDYADTMYHRARELKEWILSDEFSGNSDFALNMKSIVGAEYVSERNLGVLCYAPEGWLRALQKAAQTKVTPVAETSPSQHIGSVGERWELALTLKSLRIIESDFGITTLYHFTDSDGNVVKWYSSRGELDDFIGTPIGLTGTIKRHSVYNGVAETLVTRCKVTPGVTAHACKKTPVDKAFEIPVSMLGSLQAAQPCLMDGQYYRIRTTAGVAYAQRRTADGWEYARGTVHRLTPDHALTADDAASYGHAYGECVYCHRALTDARSTEVGYGPDCAGTYNLPWG